MTCLLSFFKNKPRKISFSIFMTNQQNKRKEFELCTRNMSLVLVIAAKNVSTRVWKAF